MNVPVFYPFPILHTPRLILRQPLIVDAADLLPMRSDPEVMRYIPRPLATCVADVETLIKTMTDAVDKGERINWAMEWKESGQVIGLIGYVNIKPEHNRAEAGYSLTRLWHRRGIMLEALKAVLRFGFDEMKLHTIEAIIDEENEPSGKLLEKAGFRQEACFREDFLFNGQYRNSIHYGMLDSEFIALQKGW